MQIECLPSGTDIKDAVDCTKAELLEQLRIMRELIPEGKPILLMLPFGVDGIPSRELIRDALLEAKATLHNVHILDPNVVISRYGWEVMLCDPLHFSGVGHQKFFEYIMEMCNDVLHVSGKNKSS